MKSSANNGHRLISLGVITTVHGVRGQVKVRSFTADPHDITAYGALQDAAGKRFDITITGGTKDALIATVAGVTTREQAELLRGTELFVPRKALPDAGENQYYHEDLVGLEVTLENGEPYGRIAAVHNFGAGDLFAIHTTSGEEELLPFNRNTFPRIDLDKGVAVFMPPEIVPDEE